MDTIYSAYNVNASAKINIGEYFLKYKQLIDSMKIDLKSELSEEQIEKISRDCSISNFITEDYYIPTPHQVTKKKLMPKIETDLNLQTLVKLKNNYSNKSKIYRPSLKYRNEITVNYTQPIETGPHIVPDRDILVYIRVYHPFSCHNSEQPKKRSTILLNHVIAILGQQTLAQLRDKIDCISDLSCTIESSENPTEFHGENNRDTYKSSFFYIENTFYNDTRDKNCKDNSATIIEWAKTRKLGPFNVESMENVRVDSLCVRFGYPWVFQHQGNCEHLITFSDARLMDADDHLAIANYPRISRVRPLKHAYCLMCIERPVHWVVLNNDRLPHDPCHFCHQCFIRYNYIDGKKIGNFKAYRYPRDNELLKRITRKKKALQGM